MKKGAAWSRPVTEVPVNWPAALPVRMLWYLRGTSRSPGSCDPCPQQPVLAQSTHWMSSTTEAQQCQLQACAATRLQCCYTKSTRQTSTLSVSRQQPACPLWTAAGEGALPSSPYSWVSSGSSFLRHLIRSLMILRLSSSSLPPLVNVSTFCAGRCGKRPLTKL